MELSAGQLIGQKDKTMEKTVTCNRCGMNGLVWYKTKQDKWILVLKQEQAYDNGVGRWVQPHPCKQTATIRNENIAYLESKIESAKKFAAEHPEIPYIEQVTADEIAKLEQQLEIIKGGM